MLTLVEIIPDPRPKKWRKSHSVFAVDEEGKTFCNLGICGSSLLICALIDQSFLRVITFQGHKVFLIPTLWLKETSLAHLADLLDAQIKIAAQGTNAPANHKSNQRGPAEFSENAEQTLNKTTNE